MGKGQLALPSWRHQETLEQGLQQPVRTLDLSDDRLESVLRYLSDDAQWALFEPALNQRQIQMYDLRPQRLRLDSTSVSADGTVNEAGLFQYGHSKDHRPTRDPTIPPSRSQRPTPGIYHAGGMRSSTLAHTALQF